MEKEDDESVFAIQKSAGQDGEDKWSTEDKWKEKYVCQLEKKRSKEFQPMSWHFAWLAAVHFLRTI